MGMKDKKNLSKQWIKGWTVMIEEIFIYCIFITIYKEVIFICILLLQWEGLLGLCEIPTSPLNELSIASYFILTAPPFPCTYHVVLYCHIWNIDGTWNFQEPKWLRSFRNPRIFQLLRYFLKLYLGSSAAQTQIFLILRNFAVVIANGSYFWKCSYCSHIQNTTF